MRASGRRFRRLPLCLGGGAGAPAKPHVGRRFDKVRRLRRRMSIMKRHLMPGVVLCLLPFVGAFYAPTASKPPTRARPVKAAFCIDPADPTASTAIGWFLAGAMTSAAWFTNKDASVATTTPPPFVEPSLDAAPEVTVDEEDTVDEEAMLDDATTLLEDATTFIDDAKTLLDEVVAAASALRRR